MIQITPQIRILVAVEPIDARKGIDSLAQLCREKLASDPFSGCLFIFRSRRGTAIKLLAYDGPRVLAGHQAVVEGAFPLVADGRRTSEGVASASGTVTAGGRQSGGGGSTGMAPRERAKLRNKTSKSAYVPDPFLAN